MLHMPSHFMPGSYNQVIHEMLEARALAMGQYSHNNQPVHHILYLLGQLGERQPMEIALRNVLNKAYGIDFFAGDEDNGEQGAWFVLSAIGLYSTTPGTPNYIIGSPLFRHVKIARPLINPQTGQAIYNDVKNNDGTMSSILSGGSLDLIATGTSSTCMQSHL